MVIQTPQENSVDSTSGLLRLAIFLLVSFLLLLYVSRTHVVSKKLNEINFKRRFNITGAQILEKSDLLKMLPNEKSNFWWSLNLPLIQNQIAKSPLVEEVELSACSGWEWGCFNIFVKERNAKFLIEFGKKFWILDGKGAILTVAPRVALSSDKKTVNDFRDRLLRIEGEFSMNSSLEKASASPDISMARIQKTINAVNKIKSAILKNNSAFALKLVRLESYNVLKVYADSFKFPFVFTLTNSDTVSDIPSIDTQISRMFNLINNILANYKQFAKAKKLGPKEISSIELGLKRVAVIKY